MKELSLDELVETLHTFERAEDWANLKDFCAAFSSHSDTRRRAGQARAG